MAETPVSSQPPQPSLFRPSKKRKIYRARGHSPSPASEPAPLPIPTVAQSLDELIASTGEEALASTEKKDGNGEKEGEVSIAEILRLRKQAEAQRRGKVGVEFRAAGGGAGERKDFGDSREIGNGGGEF
ncbi:hypothetical protein G7Y89_g64 [Cudoniella acicularis]|uniref:Uncharacterized protein n=1 Tax=Cudoniella acicularis TaxID=354080 RepID=A0A8H4W8A3_9HELO|nr:hypothetical protein G7Y89_g64 [Cudoniella acicularis]